MSGLFTANRVSKKKRSLSLAMDLQCKALSVPGVLVSALLVTFSCIRQRWVHRLSFIKISLSAEGTVLKL